VVLSWGQAAGPLPGGDQRVRAVLSEKV